MHVHGAIAGEWIIHVGNTQRMWLPSGAWSLPQAVLGVLLLVRARLW